jgi:LPXTG-motif cell wall-anchored protein
MANDIDDITYNSDGTVTVKYTDGSVVTSANQKGIDETSDKDASGGGWFASLLGAIPGILSSLFPGGIGKNNDYPTVTTTPGVTTVNTGANNTNMLLIGAVVVLAVIILFMSTKQPAKARK